MPKARITVELPPGIVLTDGDRAALISAVASKIGSSPHTHDKGQAPRLPHAALQHWIDESGATYEALMRRMLDEVAAVLESP